MASPEALKVPGFTLQDAPRIYFAAIPGQWLLKRATPSWRIDDPEEGFQRVVQERRAREIALAVLDQRRTFPNAIVLASNRKDLEVDRSTIYVPARIKLLVVDGQHRLWAQRFSDYEATYACVVHMGLTEVEMAKLFLEINDTQKRVPSSLRWDLVRLVRPDDDPAAIAATEIVYALATDEESPLFQRVDLTGEQPEITLKQGSLAPDIRQLVGRRSTLHDVPFDAQYVLLVQFFLALRDRDPDGWNDGSGPFYKARIIRALLRLLTEIVRDTGKPVTTVKYTDFLKYMKRITEQSLDPDTIRAAQGNAGIKAITDQLRGEIFPPRRGR